METRHQVYAQNSTHMTAVPSESIDLVVTSPPYPMIAMWDESFTRQDPGIAEALSRKEGNAAFELMHGQLDPVWREVHRVLKPGGIACVNIGDATRRVGDDFRLYSNHSRILLRLTQLGFSALPEILWRKPTNAPTKFMGSGMLPAGAYVTLEHEHILILRKGKRRRFTTDAERRNRRESAYFWEERNSWFSDIWIDLRGSDQKMAPGRRRERSGAYPLEVPFRLIGMYSVKGDRILDPFLGTGSTLLAAMAGGRHSIGFEWDATLAAGLTDIVIGAGPMLNRRIRKRLRDHLDFVSRRAASGKKLGHRNRYYGFPVMTRQETDLILHRIVSIEKRKDGDFRTRLEPIEVETIEMVQ